MLRRSALWSGVLSIGLPCVAIAQPVSSPAPMFGLNYANSGQSTQIGFTSQPTIAWSFRLPTFNFTYKPASLSLSGSGLLFTPGNYALNSGNGTVVWRPATGSRDSNAAIDIHGQVYASEHGALTARRVSSGDFLWDQGGTGSSDSYPTRIGPSGTIYSVEASGRMLAYRPGGQKVFDLPNPPPMQYGEVAMVPAIDPADNLYFANALGLRSIDSLGQTRWTVPSTPSTASRVMIAPGGSVVWQRDDVIEFRNPSSGTLISQFARSDALQAIDAAGNLYFSSANRIIKTSSNGAVLWTRAGPDFLDWPLTVDASGNVFASTQEGDLLAISNTGQLLWTLDLPASSPATYARAPIIDANGMIYVFHLQSQTVYAVIPAPGSMGVAIACIAIPALRRVRRQPA